MVEGVYEVVLPRPLGIVFEEVVPNSAQGVQVLELVSGGNADDAGVVGIGDVLVGVTGVKVVGAKYERVIIPAKELDFDTVMSAIGSNEKKWGAEDVVLQFKTKAAPP